MTHAIIMLYCFQLYVLNKPNLIYNFRKGQNPRLKMAILEEVDDAAPNYYQVGSVLVSRGTSK
jgi:hypothetical protein